MKTTRKTYIVVNIVKYLKVKSFVEEFAEKIFSLWYNRPRLGGTMLKIFTDLLDPFLWGLFPIIRKYERKYKNFKSKKSKAICIII